eukprot:4819800-Alexandrium_andersonii.AAC.1
MPVLRTNGLPTTPRRPHGHAHPRETQYIPPLHPVTHQPLSPRTCAVLPALRPDAEQPSKSNTIE